MRLGIDSDPCVVWAWGPARDNIWEQADIVGRPDPRWQWLTINKGAPHGFRRGQFLDIFRHDRKIATAEIERSTEKYSVAWILSGTMGVEDEPRLGDLVKIIA